ncbi:hypothetical protein CHRYSEO8AT_270004 [Chryseobacterium sp. 8AT]|nr:hypothetical protein CHRYSEO8AT_270004 [Chryseobacterium sp. 8AT]
MGKNQRCSRRCEGGMEQKNELSLLVFYILSKKNGVFLGRLRFLLCSKHKLLLHLWD